MSFLPLVSALCFAAPPPPPDLTADEIGQLAQREIVTRADLSDPTGGSAVGIVDIAASPERTFAAIVDLGARIGEISGLKALEIYDRGDRFVSARWEVKILASSVAFHIRYDLDPASGTITYALDTNKPNDIVSAEGSYRVLPTASGARLVYRSTSDSGRSVPVFLKRWLASEALSQQLTGIRARAERGP